MHKRCKKCQRRWQKAWEHILNCSEKWTCRGEYGSKSRIVEAVRPARCRQPVTWIPQSPRMLYGSLAQEVEPVYHLKACPRLDCRSLTK
eukprot:4461943-Amphidinium_carterae.2